VLGQKGRVCQKPGYREAMPVPPRVGVFFQSGECFGGFAPNLHAISTPAPNGAKFICFLWGVAPGPKYIIISLKSVSPGFKEMQKQGKHIYHLN